MPSSAHVAASKALTSTFAPTSHSSLLTAASISVRDQFERFQTKSLPDIAKTWVPILLGTTIRAASSLPSNAWAFSIPSGSGRIRAKYSGASSLRRSSMLCMRASNRSRRACRFVRLVRDSSSDADRVLTRALSLDFHCSDKDCRSRARGPNLASVSSAKRRAAASATARLALLPVASCKTEKTSSCN